MSKRNTVRPRAGEWARIRAGVLAALPPQSRRLHADGSECLAPDHCTRMHPPVRTAEPEGDQR